jgi:hypothetical protein
MIFSKLNRLAVLGTLLLAGAIPQTATPAKPKTPAAAGAAKPPAAAAANSEEITEHPEILTSEFIPSAITIFGVHVGDKTSKVPVAKMDRLSGTAPGLMKLANNMQLRYNPTNYNVTALVVSDHLTLVRAGLQDRYDVEFKFGKGDIYDERHVIYLNRRLLVTFNGNDIVGLEIR